jgi:hypothetical protein
MALLVPVLVRGRGKIVLGFLAALGISLLLVFERMLFVMGHGGRLLPRTMRCLNRLLAGYSAQACLECPFLPQDMKATSVLFPFWRQTR